MLNEPGAASYKCVACADQGQVTSPNLAAVLDCAEQFGVESRHSREILGVHAIALVLVLVVSRSLRALATMTPQASQETAHPRRYVPASMAIPFRDVLKNNEVSIT